MIFLINYNRREARIVTLRTFDNSERRQAEQARLEVELDLHRKGVENEVVLLEATSEEALRRTHQRYFEDARQIVSSSDKK